MPLSVFIFVFSFDQELIVEDDVGYFMGTLSTFYLQKRKYREKLGNLLGISLMNRLFCGQTLCANLAGITFRLVFFRLATTTCKFFLFKAHPEYRKVITALF